MITNAPRRKYRSSRKLPAATAARRSRLVAAITRGFTRVLRSPPTFRISPSWSARSSFACIVGAISPISSRNSVPVVASSNSPVLSRMAPVKAPRTCPNSSDSSRVSGSAAQFTETNGRVSALAVVVDHPRDELLPGPALAVDEHRRVEGSHPRRHLEHLPHAGAVGDELLRGRRLPDALVQGIELAFAASHPALAPREFLHLPVHGPAQAFDFPAEVGALEVQAERLERLTPTRGVSSDQGTVRLPLAQAGGLGEVDLLAQAGAGVPAGIADQRPADRARSSCRSGGRCCSAS